MAIVSISEAARLTGRNRKTIQRYVAAGRLSPSQDTRMRGIETSELIRVFGELSRPPDATASATIGHPASPQDAPLVARIHALEIALAEAKATVAAQEQSLEDLRQVVRLIKGPEKRRWWQVFR